MWREKKNEWTIDRTINVRYSYNVRPHTYVTRCECEYTFHALYFVYFITRLFSMLCVSYFFIRSFYQLLRFEWYLVFKDADISYRRAAQIFRYWILNRNHNSFHQTKHRPTTNAMSQLLAICSTRNTLRASASAHIPWLLGSLLAHCVQTGIIAWVKNYKLFECILICGTCTRYAAQPFSRPSSK